MHDAIALEEPDEYSRLKGVYGPLLRNKSWHQWHDTKIQSIIQITGPAGCGKSVLVKLICSGMKQMSSMVVITSFPTRYEEHPTLYGTCASIIHQIISQRPSLFSRIHNLMVELMRQDVWSNENLQAVFTSLLRASEKLKFLVIVHDYESWPDNIRHWWLGTPFPLMKYYGLAITFVISSHLPIKGFDSESYKIDLTKEHTRYRKIFIKAKVNSMLNHTHNTTILRRRGLSNSIKHIIISTAICFEGSFTATIAYLEHLSRTFTLNTPEAILDNLEASPRSGDSLCKHEIRDFQKIDSRVSSWASSALSWILMSVRTLRVEELAASVAFKSTSSSMAEVRAMVSIDIEQDICNHLGCIVVIENGYVRTARATGKEILANSELLKLENHYTLTKLCLGYIKLAIDGCSNEKWEKCLSSVPWKDREVTITDPELAFLDYACRFWPRHYLLVTDEVESSSLRALASGFLLTPGVGDRWFELYQLCNSQLLNGNQTKDNLLRISGRPTFTPSLIDKSLEVQAAVCMASYVGLGSLIGNILGESIENQVSETINTRRGYSEHYTATMDPKSEYHLSCAISNDNEDLVEKILARHTDMTKCFPLHQAARLGSLRAARMLSLSIAQRDQDGRTPLHFAVIGASIPMVRWLIGVETVDTYAVESSEIDVRDDNLQTPLILACRMGNAEIATLLISCGADHSIKDNNGKTALDYAIFSCANAVQILAAKGMTDNGNNGRTPLHLATWSKDAKITLILVDALRTR